MRRRIVAGNWKMNLGHREGAALAAGILADAWPRQEVLI